MASKKLKTFVAIENSTGEGKFLVHAKDKGWAWRLLAEHLGQDDPGNVDYDLFEPVDTPVAGVAELCPV